MSQVSTIQFLNKYYRTIAIFNHSVSFSLIYEAYHALIGQPWSKSFIFDNKHILNTKIIGQYQDGVDDNQKFRSNDNKEITLPILLLSRYFSYFEPLLSGTREEVVNIDQPIETLKMIMSIVHNDRTNIDCSDLKDRLKYFGPKNEFYLLIPVQHDFDDDDAMVYLGKLLRNMFKNTLFEDSVYKCNDGNRDDKMYFVSYQRLGFSEGKLFAAEYLYRYGDHELGLNIYINHVNKHLHTISMLWIKRIVDYLKPSDQEYEDIIDEITDIDRVKYEEMTFHIGILTYTNVKTMLFRVQEQFIGHLDENDKNVLTVFGVLSTRICNEIKTLCGYLLFGKPIWCNEGLTYITSKLVICEEQILDYFYTIVEKMCSYDCHDKRKECENIKELLDIVRTTKKMCTAVEEKI